MTRRNLIARLRNGLKEVTADTQYTNRYLWHTLWSVAKVIIKRDAENRALYLSSNFWQTVCINMEPVSPILCDCINLPLDCVLYRSTEKLPKFLEISNGPLIRSVGSIDFSEHLLVTSPFQYSIKSKLRFRKEKYVFFHDGYLWSPDVSWPKILISGIFSEATGLEQCTTTSGCSSILELEAGVPDHLEYDIIRTAIQELAFPKQINKDEHPNTNSSQLQASP